MLVALVLTTIAASRPDAPTKRALVQAEAEHWVKAHRSALPTQYDDFAVLPLPYRRAIQRALPINIQGELWQHHLEAFVLPDSVLTPMQRETRKLIDHPLTEQQRAFVKMLLDSVVKQAFAPGLSDERRRAIVEPFCTKAQVVLGKDLQNEIMATLGPVDTAYRALLKADADAKPLTKTAGLVDFALAKQVIRAGLRKVGLYHFPQGCTCNTSSLCDCPSNYFCVANTGCTVLSTGCGCFGRFECDADGCAHAT